MINSRTKTLLLCGAIACPFFMIIVLMEGAMRSDYNSFQFPLSSLAIGNTGWTQIANFIFTGILIIAFSFGLKNSCITSFVKFKGPILIRLVGVGLIGAGIFVTDPIYGYPTDKPIVLRQFTFHGHLHDGFSMLVFICLPWACFVFRKYFILKNEHGWASYSKYTGYLMIAFFILTSLGFKQVPVLVNYAGVLQRLCISSGWLWMTLLSLYLYKKQTKKLDEYKNKIT